MIYIAACFLPFKFFYPKLLLSQTIKNIPLDCERTRVQCMYTEIIGHRFCSLYFFLDLNESVFVPFVPVEW